MLKYPCLVLDHDDTVVQSEATVNYPCFCQFLSIHRPEQTISLEDYVRGCSSMTFVQMCKEWFDFSDELMQVEYQYWKDYAKTHIPDTFPGMKELLHAYRNAGGKICVSSMSAQENILRDYRTHFDLEPDLIFGWDLPEHQRKPNTYAIESICAHYGFSQEQLLVVDDMKFAVPMARNAGCPIAFAGWGRLLFPQIYREMSECCDYAFDSPQDLQKFLLEEY